MMMRPIVLEKRKQSVYLSQNIKRKKIMKKIEKRGGLCDLDTLDREEGQILDDVDYVEKLVIK